MSRRLQGRDKEFTKWLDEQKGKEAAQGSILELLEVQSTSGQQAVEFTPAAH